MIKKQKRKEKADRTFHHYYIFPTDREFILNDEHYLDVLKLYHEKGLIENTVGEIYWDDNDKRIEVRGMTWHVGRMKVRAAGRKES